MKTSAFAAINKYGLSNKLKQIYGPHLVATPEEGYNVTLQVDLAKVGEKPGAWHIQTHIFIHRSASSLILAPICLFNVDELFSRFALLKRHVFAQPFEFVFESLDQGKTVTEIMDIPYRGEERTFITAPSKDRVTVVYAINFRDKDDIILGKVFMGVRFPFDHYDNTLGIT